MARVAGFVSLVGAAIALLAASDSSFYLASGSDASVKIYTPTLTSKLFALAVAITALGWAVLRKRGSAWRRWTAAGVGLIVLALATHAVIVNFKRSTLQEHWLFVKIDRLSFDAAEGIPFEWEVVPVPAGVRLTRRRDHHEVFVFTGIAPWRTDFVETFVKRHREVTPLRH